MQKVLIVDDCQYWQSKNALALKKFNITPDIAKSAKEGVEKIIKNLSTPYDLIITDMQMEKDFSPLYAGEWLLQQIQKHEEYKNSKIFIISSVPEIAKITLKYGVNYLPKNSLSSLLKLL